MDKIVIEGGKPLHGSIAISGSKNACLPLMAACLLTPETLTLKNVPDLADMATMATLLGSLGVEVWRDREASAMQLRAARIENHLAHYEIVRKMRASILVLGPLLARSGQAVVSLPGGCAIGARPVDLHLKGLEEMGASLELKGGYVHAAAKSGLKGAHITFPLVSVGATENLLMTACLVSGTTVLENAATEPEITDLAHCLTAMGANIEGIGTGTLTITGIGTLTGATHSVVADRIELGSYMIAPVITGGEVELIGGDRALVASLIERLEAADATVENTDAGLKVRRANGAIRAVDIQTEPFPGYPTDLQAQMMALMCLADGQSTIDETIFENRFMHAPELMRMGANIEVSGGQAQVKGVKSLRGAPVMATDLRASMSLLLAGLAAEGTTTIRRVYHLDRGYERVVRKLRGVGAQIERVRDDKGHDE